MKKYALLLPLMLVAISSHAISKRYNREITAYLGKLVTLDQLAADLNLSPVEAFRAALAYRKVVVDLFAPWCGPCKTLTPQLERMAGMKRDVLFLKIDIEQHPQVAKRFAVRSIPTLLYFMDSQLVGRVVGANSSEIEDKAKAVFLNN